MGHFGLWRKRFSKLVLGNAVRRRRRVKSFQSAEALEDRLLLTNFMVNTTADVIAKDGVVSLREAIQAANTNAAVGDAAAGSASGDTIRFAASLTNRMIHLQLGELTISDDLFINGRTQKILLVGTETSRIFNIDTAQNVSIVDLSCALGNTEENGGAIAVAGGGTTLLSRLRIYGCEANGDGGGAIYNVGSRVTVANSVLSGNVANGPSGSGGAILNGAGGRLTVTSSTIIENVANRAGGGIEDASDADLGVVLRDVFLLRNRAGVSPGTPAPGNGGGLHVTGAGDVLITGGAVSGNEAALEGGGLWNGTGTMTVSRTTITGNTANGDAADDGGGGIFNNGGDLVVTFATISNNKADGAAGSGGGIFSAAGDVTVAQSKILGNTANRAGGGVELIVGTLDFSFSRLIGNTAGPAGSAAPGNGGGFHVTGAGATVTFRDSYVGANVAAREGGGLWNASGSTMVVVRTSIYDNRSLGTATDVGGGGIFNNGGTLHITSSALYRNSSAGDGGGLFIKEGGPVLIQDTTFVSNDADRNGGGLYNNAVTTLNDSLIGLNTALDGGGIFNGIVGVSDLNSTSVVNNTPNDTAGPGVVT